MQINLINQTTIDGYIHLGLGSITATFNGTTLDATSSIPIAAGSTVTGFDLTYADGGKLLFSLGDPLPSNNPTFQQGVTGDGTGWQVRWDKVEVTLLTGTQAVYSSMNLSSTDFYGLDLQVDTYASAKATTPETTLGWTGDADTLFPQLATIASNNPAIAVPGTADGVNVKGVGDNVLRIISPSTVPPADQSSYASMQPYVDFIQSHSIVTQIKDQYSNGTPSGASTTTQTLQFSASIPTTGDNAGDLVMVGSGSAIGAGHTIVVTDLAAAIINTNPNPFYVDGAEDSFANNDAYGVVVRDMLAGFNAGLVGSTEINPNSGNRYVDDAAGFTNAGFGNTEWYPVPDVKYAFGGAQPDHSNFYNQYAGVIAANSDSYGFPYTDVLASPIANIDPSQVDHINITILPDSFGPGPNPCFAAGTHLVTPSGLVPVERLRIGEELLTVSGVARRIVWIGHRDVDCTRHPNPALVWPVRIARGAFGPRAPWRDLYLSPDHAVFVDDVLVPVKHLVNGTTLRQERRERITYFHIELDRHDVLLAEGLPVESYLETGARAAFANADTVLQLHPRFAAEGAQAERIWESYGYAPLVVAGERLEDIKARLDCRAADSRSSIAARVLGSERHVG